LRILEITNKVYDYYRLNTKGNEEISKDQAARKLTRNVILAMPVPPRSEFESLLGNRKYVYGNLHIIIRGDRIIHIYNHYGGKKAYGGWIRDEERYAELTKQLGILS
jgi:hypothetical protein